MAIPAERHYPLVNITADGTTTLNMPGGEYAFHVGGDFGLPRRNSLPRTSIKSTKQNHGI